MATTRRAPASLPTRSRLGDRYHLAAALIVAIAFAVAVRLPALLATRHLSFDDGVYGASALAMRDGALPFREVFSSQGPLFLPLVWLADLLGGRTLDAPRLLAVAAGVVLVVAMWSAARTLGCSPAAAALAAGLVASSGSVLWVTGPLTSDGPALALATTAVATALAWRRAPSLPLALLAGVALGAALAVKSLLVAAVVPVALVLRADRRHLAAATGGALAVGLLATAPWGFGAVWDQSVTYHLEAAGPRTPEANAAKLASTLLDRDLPLVLAAAAGVAALGLRRRPAGGQARPPAPATGGGAPVAAWLAATAAVLLLQHPLWRNHVAHLAPAAALLTALSLDGVRFGWAARRRRAVATVAVVVAGAAAYHVAHVRPVLWPAPPPPAEAAARADLAALPEGAWAISDEPGLVWRTGRRTPADLVDASVLRIDSGRITSASVAAAAADARVCAVLVWSSRFDRLDLASHLEGYVEAARYGAPRVLYVKETCRP